MRQIAVSGPQALDINQAATLEWLVTNGTGGFASGTVAGINTRRYHAVLLSAPRVENRYVLVSQVQEELDDGTDTWLLGASYYPGAVHPGGFRHLLRFVLYPYPTWVYAVGAWVVEKRLAMVHGVNATVVKYRVLDGPGKLKLILRPFLAGRDYHHTRRQHNSFKLNTSGQWNQVNGGDHVPAIWLAGSGNFTEGGLWINNVRYPIEEERGLDCEEDLYIPGEYSTTLSPGEDAWFVAWSGKVDELTPQAEPHVLVGDVYKDAILRQSELLDLAGSPTGVAANLVVAADAFIIKRETTSVIAGYPWFTDWGRDAMISIPGLFLATGRSAEALSVLTTFAATEKDGLIPNRFPDRSSEPEYNTVDAPLWFIYACDKYARYTHAGDNLVPLLSTIRSIILGYQNGTHFGIGADERGLVRAGELGYQLTWMDAKVDNWVVTPREGYPVEINALWYNALRCAARLCRDFDASFAADCLLWADRAAQSFVDVFWSPEHGYLADVVDSSGKRDMSLRPNQLFAVSLPYPVCSGELAQAVVQQVWQHLYTPMGLRSLSPTDDSYHGEYKGNQWHRDSAYHRGTVWAWLIGPFITAYRQAFGRTTFTRSVARTLTAPLLDHLWDAGLGHISEVFWGDTPHTPGGCPAQAWSVAEMLRLWVEEFDKEPFEEATKGRQVFHGY